MVFIGALTGSQKGDTKIAVGGFIGFIPFGFSNDKKLLWGIMGLTAILAMLWVLMHLRVNN